MFLINPYILQASGNPLWNDLQAYYTADNTPNDALGTYNGTLTNGATYGTGIINQGFSFDGVNDYVDLPSNTLSLSGDFSVSLWFKSTVNNGYYILLSNYKTGGYGIKIDLRNTNNIRCVIYNVSTYSLLSTTTFNTGQWYHVVFTRKNNTGSKIYINGTLDNSDSNTVNPNYGSTLYPAIGVSEYNTGQFEQYYNGIIDEVGIWNRELSASEVTELYNSGAGLQY